MPRIIRSTYVGTAYTDYSKVILLLSPSSSEPQAQKLTLPPQPVPLPDQGVDPAPVPDVVEVRGQRVAGVALGGVVRGDDGGQVAEGRGAVRAGHRRGQAAAGAWKGRGTKQLVCKKSRVHLTLAVTAVCM